LEKAELVDVRSSNDTHIKKEPREKEEEEEEEKKKKKKQKKKKKREGASMGLVWDGEAVDAPELTQLLHLCNVRKGVRSADSTRISQEKATTLRSSCNKRNTKHTRPSKRKRARTTPTP
jgi:hypothetical protein